jgi:hypothetical protein
MRGLEARDNKTPDMEVRPVKTRWHLFFVAALLPVAGAVHASSPLAAGLESPDSFDAALRGNAVELTSMMEPTPADGSAPEADATAAHAAPPASSTIAGNCSCMGCCDPCGDSCCDCGSACACGPVWTVRAGAAILQRSNPTGRAVIRDRAVGAAVVARADIFDFDQWEGGPDLTIARWFQNGTGIEARYFGTNQWDDDRTFGLPAQWQVEMADAPIQINGIGTISACYLSRLSSTEVNWRGGLNQNLALLAGFRWIELHENLGVSADVGGVNVATANWNTDNHLYGGQVGAILQLLKMGRRFSADTWFKGGIYGNDADNQFNFTSLGPNLAGHTSRGQTAFVGDIQFSGSYWFTDHIALRSGYQLLWVDGVALASDQVNASSSITGHGIHSNGDVFYHGALIGLDFTW